MVIPETAAEALVAWKSKQPLEAVRIGPAGANQAVEWGRVFDIIEVAPIGSKFSLQQFEAWCWNNRIGVSEAAAAPAVAAAAANQSKEQTESAAKAAGTAQTSAIAEFGKYTEARVMAYSIIREGFANVIRRRRLSNPASATLVQKL